MKFLETFQIHTAHVWTLLYSTAWLLPPASSADLDQGRLRRLEKAVLLWSCRKPESSEVLTHTYSRTLSLVRANHCCLSHLLHITQQIKLFYTWRDLFLLLGHLSPVTCHLLPDMMQYRLFICIKLHGILPNSHICNTHSSESKGRRAIGRNVFQQRC